MKAILECILASTLCGIVLCSVLHRNEENDIASYDPSSQDDAGGYLNFMNYLQSQQQKLHSKDRGFAGSKRFTDFSMPYMKYKVDKRGDGVWIWMPAQGYVSVPHQQEEGENSLAKQGKIMRYGK